MITSIRGFLICKTVSIRFRRPYVRAIQTVEGLAKLIHKEILIDSRFRERDLAGRDHHFERPEEAMKYVFNHPTFKFPGGESNQEVQERGIAALIDVITNYKGQKVAIGIHGNIMTCTMNFFDEKYDFDFWKSTSKPDIYKLCINQNFNLVDCKDYGKNPS